MNPKVESVTMQHDGVTRLRTKRTYDNVNGLREIASTNSTLGSPLVFGYGYNAANQRVSMTNADNTFWNYGYDRLGQVTNGWRFWTGGSNVLGQTFNYRFDDIGNRVWTQTGGDSSGGSLRTANYFPNLLNQYTNRTVPGFVEVGGVADTGATLTVNGATAERQSAYFRSEIAVTNSGGALAQWLNTAAVNAGGASVVSRLAYIPQTPEAFTHDEDGNLTSDGLWVYTWNGENRLIRIETRTNAITDSTLWKRIDNDYDFQGRRLRQRTSSWDSGLGSFHQTGTVRFFYDGWNLIGQVDEVTGARSSFVWGLDLSGTPQGAGGVGGLTAMIVHNGSEMGAYFYAYDGNGNIAGLVNGSDGSEAARYEYGPFGETIAVSGGSVANLNRFRWSTKFADEFTGLSYYGYRYYNSSTGRWLSRDPMAEEGGLNVYSFINNDSINNLDPFGLFLGVPDTSGNFHPIASLAITKLEIEMRDYEVGRVTGLLNALARLKNIIPRIKRVTVDPSYVGKGASAEYVPFRNWMRLRGDNPDGVDVAHETVHAYNKLVSGLSSNDRTDEGMAYTLEQTYSALTNFRRIEDLLKADCQSNRDQIAKLWKTLWSTYATPAHFGGGNLNDRAKTFFNLTAAVFANVNTHFGLKFSCGALANAFTQFAYKGGAACFLRAKNHLHHHTAFPQEFK